MQWCVGDIKPDILRCRCKLFHWYGKLALPSLPGQRSLTTLTGGINKPQSQHRYSIIVYAHVHIAAPLFLMMRTQWVRRFFTCFTQYLLNACFFCLSILSGWCDNNTVKMTVCRKCTPHNFFKVPNLFSSKMTFFKCNSTINTFLSYPGGFWVFTIFHISLPDALLCFFSQ